MEAQLRKPNAGWQHRSRPYNAERRRAKASTPRCFNPECDEPILYELDRAAFRYRGRTHYLCGPCRRRYWKADEQAAKFGTRYRFIEKAEVQRATTGVPRPYELFTDVFCLLQILAERQRNLRKEVNWMADESAKRLIQLPGKLAAILVGTYAVAGDAYKLADDEALTRIRDLLDEIDPEIIARARKKKKRRS